MAGTGESGSDHEQQDTKTDKMNELENKITELNKTITTIKKENEDLKAK